MSNGEDYLDQLLKSVNAKKLSKTSAIGQLSPDEPTGFTEEAEPVPNPIGNDDPNHTMTPEEIEALIAATEGVADSDETAEELLNELGDLGMDISDSQGRMPEVAISDDSNHMMTPEEIEALLAGASAAVAESALDATDAIEVSDPETAAELINAEQAIEEAESLGEINVPKESGAVTDSNVAKVAETETIEETDAVETAEPAEPLSTLELSEAAEMKEDSGFPEDAVAEDTVIEEMALDGLDLAPLPELDLPSADASQDIDGEGTNAEPGKLFEGEEPLGDLEAAGDPGSAAADDGLGDLLDAMGYDEDLSEIHDMLKKSDRDESISADEIDAVDIGMDRSIGTDADETENPVIDEDGGLDADTAMNTFVGEAFGIEADEPMDTETDDDFGSDAAMNTAADSDFGLEADESMDTGADVGRDANDALGEGTGISMEDGFGEDIDEHIALMKALEMDEAVLGSEKSDLASEGVEATTEDLRNTDHGDALEENADDLTNTDLGEESPKEKKKRLKKEKAEQKKKAKEEKEPGLLQKFLAFLFDADEELEDETEPTDENQQILDEIAEEDRAKKKKEKPKKEKPKKEKPKKEKKEKQKKPPKPKKEKKPDAPDQKSKPLGINRILAAAFVGLTTFGVIQLFTGFIPGFVEDQNAMNAFRMGEYETAYETLQTKELSGDLEKAYRGSACYMQMKRSMDSYNNYRILNEKNPGKFDEYALNALIQGVKKYNDTILGEADTYGVKTAVHDVYLNLLSSLQTEYGVSEERAIEVGKESDKIEYTRQMKEILGKEIGESVEESNDSE